MEDICLCIVWVEYLVEEKEKVLLILFSLNDFKTDYHNYCTTSKSR